MAAKDLRYLSSGRRPSGELVIRVVTDPGGCVRDVVIPDSTVLFIIASLAEAAHQGVK